ncbi:hypothetical protein OG306_12500 [Streptomyces sp. NBC_01241]|uniref:hypothetical protein n=1 Tax=Streptomyces sp. NBC_01241 TaxID=2903794 RepID=UPI00352DBC07|nr:hypothetical protein OG306_12500 [Streptomyces sp. NBC_01241]
MTCLLASNVTPRSGTAVGLHRDVSEAHRRPSRRFAGEGAAASGELVGVGEFEAAVGKARSALDAVRDACKTWTVCREASKKPANDRSQAERWAVLIQEAYALFSGAQHDDARTTEHFTWWLADAAAAVAAAAGLLARLEDLP